MSSSEVLKSTASSFVARASVICRVCLRNSPVFTITPTVCAFTPSRCMRRDTLFESPERISGAFCS